MWLGSQAFYSATAFNADIGAWNTAAMTTMASVCALIAIACVCEVCASCLLVCFAHFSSIRMPSAAADRACGHACMRLPCFTHFSSIILWNSDGTESLSPGFRPPNRRSCAASRPSSARALLRTHSAHRTLRCTLHWTDCRGSGLMRLGLSGERVARLAGVFRGDGVQREHRSLEHCCDDDNGLCMRPQCHRQCVRSVCFMLACVLRSFLEYSYAIGRVRSSLRRCMLLPCFTHFSSIIMRTSDGTESPSGVAPAQTAAVAPHLERQQHRSARTWPTHRALVHNALD